MNARFLIALALAFSAASAWAQQGGGPHPRPPGGASFGAAPRDNVDPRRQRDELRSLIRDQHRAEPAPEYAKGFEPSARQLSREEREALREQLRRQRPEHWRREP